MVFIEIRGLIFFYPQIHGRKQIISMKVKIYAFTGTKSRFDMSGMDCVRYGKIILMK